MDPKWYIASNELAAFNSLKMKLAVIIGVIQMMFGIGLKGLNCLYFKEYIAFVFEWLPQMLFMIVTFAFMDALIIIKWSSDYTGANSANAPGIIN